MKFLNLVILVALISGCESTKDVVSNVNTDSIRDSHSAEANAMVELARSPSWDPSAEFAAQVLWENGISALVIEQKSDGINSIRVLADDAQRAREMVEELILNASVNDLLLCD